MVSSKEVTLKVNTGELSQEEQSTLESIDEYVSYEIKNQYKCDANVVIDREKIDYRISSWAAGRGAAILNELFVRFRDAGWRVKVDDETFSLTPA